MCTFLKTDNPISIYPISRQSIYEYWWGMSSAKPLYLYYCYYMHIIYSAVVCHMLQETIQYGSSVTGRDIGMLADTKTFHNVTWYVFSNISVTVLVHLTYLSYSGKQCIFSTVKIEKKCCQSKLCNLHRILR